MMRGRALLLAGPLALALTGRAIADPLPQGTAAPNAPEVQTVPDKAQPPPAPEPNDVPPVAPKAEPEPAQPPEAEKQPEPNPPAKAVEAPKNTEPVAPSQAFAILGKKVHGPDGKDVLGAIIDILVDDQGHPRAAIVDFGGFLGVGSRKIAVDWQLIKFHPTDTAVPIVLDLDRNQIKAAPEYKDPTQPAEVVEPTVATTPAPPPPATGDGAAPPETPLSEPSPPPPGSVAEPASPPPDTAAPPDADKHTN